MSGSRYIHGSDPEEQERLGLMNALLNEQGLREMRLRPGESILDVGCGTAIFAREMAACVGEEGRVVGVERDSRQIEKALRLGTGEQDVRVEVRQGDALALPLRDAEWGSFDVVHARFLLEHLADPLAAVRQMMQAARPGGRVVLVDDDHEVFRPHPGIPGFEPVWREYMRSFERWGFDPRVGRELVVLLKRAGAVASRNTCLFFGSCAGMPSFPVAVDNLVGVLEGAREAVLSGGSLSSRDLDGTVAAIRSWASREDAALWYTADWAEGVAPGRTGAS